LESNGRVADHPSATAILEPRFPLWDQVSEALSLAVVSEPLRFAIQEPVTKISSSVYVLLTVVNQAIVDAR
jgi:hypothetical protein